MRRKSGLPAASTIRGGPRPMSAPTVFEQYMLELVNRERAKAGVQPLAFDGDLNQSADRHSRWMISTDTFSHTGAGR